MSGFKCKCKADTFVLEMVVTVQEKPRAMTTPETRLRCTNCDRSFSEDLKEIPKNPD